MNVLNCLSTFVVDFDIIFWYYLSFISFSLCLCNMQIRNLKIYAKWQSKNKLGGRTEISPVDKAGQGNQAKYVHGQIWLGLPQKKLWLKLPRKLARRSREQNNTWRKCKKQKTNKLRRSQIDLQRWIQSDKVCLTIYYRHTHVLELLLLQKWNHNR